LNSNKRTGTLYEALFVVRAMREGLEPHSCHGEYLAHDFIVTNSAGKSFRTQVKGTAFKSKRRRWQITAGSGKNKRPLDCTKIDILAAYIEPLNVWYLVPCMKIKSVSLWFYPDCPESKAQYEKFLDVWDAFK
jgi:hypothetical protein